MKLMGPIVLALLLGLVTCRPIPRRMLAPPPGCEEVITYQIDRNFPSAERDLVVASFGAWARAMNQRTCFVPGTQGFRISRADDTKTTSRIDTEAHDRFGITMLIGWADTGIGRAWIFPYRIHSDHEYFGVAAHEIGHLLGLKHYTGGQSSWMHPQVMDTPPEEFTIPEHDVRTVCDMHPCN